jgi:putative ABC transport system substrate-binding protein
MGTQAALLARATITRVPVVFTGVTHPVESGLAASWDRAGGNLCGISDWIASEKVLHAFRLAVPHLRRLGAVRSTGSGEVSAAELRQMQRHLWEPSAPPVELVEQVVERKEDLAAAVARLRARGVDAVWLPIDHLVYSNAHVLLEALRGSGVPLLSSALRGPETGATLGVLVDYGLLGERTAAMARVVLTGKATPESLPIGTMQSYQVAVNLAAAKACAYELPLGALLVADRILDRDEAPAHGPPASAGSA